ncbi:Arginine biosynthesis bifunctional protein ArgJ (Includes: Glutamate N-acetyltransferase; Amino-acid acetyltransferase) [uncultured Desulfobacterium sp.]|uniref:Arginine biosynthesis bifunctional protein ArgJ n=1 Tax=uncultured Desulfobacterium sp. TaxID=201089 RepID=A0A445N0H8_9BACT|nr:Arginine biosynthesis bifunctional protein ArgJ (Includes: Glutamate N-acetyltransferase; Amino-acid acetyltransferase) [uncultured Desulfobacterium sp.]
MDSQNIVMAKGFKASAAAAGLKKNKGLDISLIYSECDATAAGVFTTNKVKAAPVLLTRENISSGRARAIIANAGNANACTGQAGLENARTTVRLVADGLGLRPEDILVASTGVIGKPLDMDLVSAAIPKLIGSLSADGLTSAATAIMTTDSFLKFSQYDGHAGGSPFCIQGIAKGAGMIMPDMATMLCFIISDIAVEADDLKKALHNSVERTFNRITVDGDTSTNDMVLVLANGTAGNGRLSQQDFGKFQSGLTQVMGELARMIAKDGEGASKLVDLQIKGAMSAEDAINAARTVANSSLVKTAFYGQDPNWGRIMAALGRSGIVMDEASVDIWVNDIQIVSNGLGLGVEVERRAAEMMTLDKFTVTVDLKQGRYEDKVVTCDLTHDYVSINADYRT